MTSRRRDSNASERDFFDIPDEPILAIAKRQLRRIRTWVIFILFILFIKYLRREVPPPKRPSPINYDLIDWSRLAYSQYATSSPYLCNAVLVFDALERFGSRAQRVLFYPQDWDIIVENDRHRDSQLLQIAKDKYGALLVPIEMDVIKPDAGPDETWDKSISKLLPFGEIEFERIIHLDSDILLRDNIDELFFLPPATVAMPRAYWLLPETKQLSSLLLVIEPSYREYSALMEIAVPAMDELLSKDPSASRPHLYDMEILNDRYGDSALVLPHRRYGLLTGEFRRENHTAFLGNDYEEWDPDKALAEAKFVHFSDWPLPKPWIMWPHQMLGEILPKCKFNPGTIKESGCRDREVWMSLYDEFRVKRRDVCKLLSYKAPPWPLKENEAEKNKDTESVKTAQSTENSGNTGKAEEGSKDS